MRHDDVIRLLRPLAARVANTIARAVVQVVNDVKKLQILQVGVLDEETIDDAEHHQPYGFSSVPLDGAEAVVVFPNGDRSHPLVIAVSDRRYRPTDGKPGQVDLYHYTGARMTFLEDGDVELVPAPGREVFIRDEGGTVDRLVKKSEFDGHSHAATGLTCTGGTVAGTTAGAPPVAGTEKLRVQ